MPEGEKKKGEINIWGKSGKIYEITQKTSGQQTPGEIIRNAGSKSEEGMLRLRGKKVGENVIRRRKRLKGCLNKSWKPGRVS